MRAPGIAGRHEKRKSGGEDEDPLIAMNHSHLRLDVTEDDDDDEDDEVAKNKQLILVAKDVKTGTYAATGMQENGVSECATSWLVSLLRRLGDRRARLPSDGAPSIVALNNCNFAGSPVCRYGFARKPSCRTCHHWCCSVCHA